MVAISTQHAESAGGAKLCEDSDGGDDDEDDDEDGRMMMRGNDDQSEKDEESEDDDDDDDYLADLMQSDAVGNWNLGKTSVYKIDNDTNSIPIHYNTHHRYRGGGLRDLTRSEYECVIRVQKKTTSKASATPTATTGSRPGHVRNKRFPFDDGHVLAASHEQVFKNWPYLTGRQPAIPSNESSAKKQLHSI
jgi:hypothetical protein